MAFFGECVHAIYVDQDVLFVLLCTSNGFELAGVVSAVSLNSNIPDLLEHLKYTKFLWRHLC
jgi:hypothetical protein